jgi:hypothetical protein
VPTPNPRRYCRLGRIRPTRRRILTDLAPGGVSAKLTNKLADWPTLDFKTFHDEVKKTI